MPTRTVTIINKKGLHARAAAKLVKCAATFDSDIRVKRLKAPDQAELLDDADASVCARSILGLMMLGASSGIILELTATGADAEAALNAIIALIEARFDEGE
jgi:phosphocarrier protein HPr